MSTLGAVGVVGAIFAATCVLAYVGVSWWNRRA